MESTPPPAMSFEEWFREVDRLCLRHLCCSWHDLCGDEPPLRQSHEAGDAPMAFVEWWARKYDLFWVDPSNPWDVWT
jgi:hypothetical protein